MCTYVVLKLCYIIVARARIEKDYGDSLVRLAKNASGKDEIA